jgi:hypothetical protein
MAGRILNRRELRKQADQGGPSQADALDVVPAGGAPKPRGKPATPPKAKKSRAKKVPPRLRARWGVFDGGMKQVAIFDYNQRGAADAKLADLLARNKGFYFLQIVKEPMPEPAPAAVPADTSLN